MDATSNATAPLVSERDLRIMGKAAAVLKRIETAAARAAWDAPTDPMSNAPKAQDYGRLAGAADELDFALFKIANIAETYAGVADAVHTFNMAEAREDERGRA